MQAPSAYSIIDMKDVEDRSVSPLETLKFQLPNSSEIDYDHERNYYYKHINDWSGSANYTENQWLYLFVISYGVSLPSE